jgi:hypothetical protein
MSTEENKAVVRRVTLGGDWHCKVRAVPMHLDEARDVARSLRSAE